MKKQKISSMNIVLATIGQSMYGEKRATLFDFLKTKRFLIGKKYAKNR